MPESDPTKRSTNKIMASVARYSGVTMLMPASAFAGYLLGYGLDYVFHTHFLRAVFLILGVAAGLVQVVRELTRAND